MSAPALVTGAPGWLGSRLVRALAQGLPDFPALAAGEPGRAVRALVHHGRGTEALKSIAPGVGTFPGDLTAPDTLADFFRGAEGATVFHCAGVIHPSRGIREIRTVNVEGTRNLLAAARRAGVRRFILVSSSAACGFNPDPRRPMDEDTPCRPFMNYGRSKRAAEELVRAEAESGGLEAVVLRAPWFHGPGQPPRQTRFFSAVRRGRFPVIGAGENLRSMVYIDNLCAALLLAEKSADARGRVYWIADARPYAMAEVVATVERAMRDMGISVSGRRPPRLPALAGSAGLALDTLLQGIGKYRAEFHVLAELGSDIHCSIERARRELGYEPAVDLYEGTRRSLLWLRESGMEV